MIKSLSILSIFTFAIQLSFSQTDFFLGDCQNDFSRDAVQDNAGNTYILTSTSEFNGNNLEYLPMLTKLDASHTEVWSKKYTHTDFRNSQVKDLAIFNDTIIMCGAIDNSSATTPNGWVQFFALFDIQGNFLDAHFYEEGIFNSIEVDYQHYYLTGTQNTANSSQFKIVTTNHNGTPIWIKGIDAPNQSEGERSFVNDDHLLTAGYRDLSSSGSFKVGRLSLMNYQKNGTLNWKKYYEFYDNSPTYQSRNFPLSIVYHETDSTYWISGTFENSTEPQAHILKIRADNGNVIWNNIYDFQDIQTQQSAVGMVKDGNYTYLYGLDQVLQTNVSDIVVAQLNENGNLNWLNGYGDIQGNHIISLLSADSLYSIGHTSNSIFTSMIDGHFFAIDNISGASSKLLPNTMNSSVMSMNVINVIDVASDQNYTTAHQNFQLTETIITPGVLDTSFCGQSGISEFANTSVTVFPNPTHSHFSVKSNLIIDAVILFDTEGRVVLSQHSTFDSIDTQDLVPGMYLVEIVMDQTTMQRKLYVTH